MDGKETFESFLNAFMSVWSIHKTGEPSETIIDAYWSVLEKYDIEKIQAAFGYAISNLMWFPKPVELIQFIENGPGNVEDVALIEADNVVNAVRSVGHYESVTFDDPVTMAVIQQGWGGWVKLGNELLENDVKWFRKDFARIYKAYSAQGIKKHGHLIGQHEDSNMARFPEAVDGPVLIGDTEKAKLILEHDQANLIEDKSGD